MLISIVQPLVDRFYDAHDVSTGTNNIHLIYSSGHGSQDLLGIVYSLLVNRVQFLHERPSHAHHQSVNITRALLCELVASKVLQLNDVDNLGSQALLLLAKVLVADFDPFQNAPDEVT
jgi:hypothetical protein